MSIKVHILILSKNKSSYLRNSSTNLFSYDLIKQSFLHGK